MFKDFNMHVSGTDSCSLQGEGMGVHEGSPHPPLGLKIKLTSCTVYLKSSYLLGYTLTEDKRERNKKIDR